MGDSNGNSSSAPNPDVLRHSVTRDDYATDPRQGLGSIWYWQFPNLVGGFADLPPYWSPLRDRVLRTTPMREAMWASAVHIATSKVATRDWRLDGRRTQYWHDLLNAADNNQSFVSFIEKIARDFILTDNGCFVEIIRSHDARGARIIGLVPLSSWKCIRTGNPDKPLIYRDRNGHWHEMFDYQVISMCDEPENGFSYYNIDLGFCAASRAFPAIIKLAALETYIYEKISGKRPLDIALVNAQITSKQIQNAIDVQKQESIQKGFTSYMGVTIVPILDPTAAPAVAHIPIAGLPDNFKPEEERREAKLTYADAIGMDPLELDPELATRGKSLGTGAQAQVLDDKQTGRGMRTFDKKISFHLNDKVLPPRVQFSMYEIDLADLGRRAEISERRAKAMRELVGANAEAPQIITPAEAKNALVDMDELPREFLAADLTGDEVLRDTEKPAVIEGELIAATVERASARDLRLRAKEYDDRVNAAERWAIDERVPHYYLMDDDELVTQYDRAHPFVQKETKALALAVKETKETTPAVQPQLIVVQSAPQPITFNLPQQQKENAPSITLEPQIHITLPEQPAPIVNVTNNVEPPNVAIMNEVPVPKVEVTVPTPNVKVVNKAAQVKVNVPEAPAPIVTVNVPVEREETSTLIRDKEGVIQKVIKKVTRAE